MKMANLFLGPEGGFGHVAAALNKPAVILFGGWIHPKSTGYDFHENIYIDINGSPCGIRDTECDHCKECMSLIKTERVIKAVENIPCTLLIVGELDDYSLNLLKDLKVDYLNYVSVDKQELESLYLESDLITFPSFHEGFGLPIIEAQASGTPVITSNISPMKEVAGEGAVLVDPSQKEDIRSAILELLRNDELTKKLVKKGKRNADLYSVKIVANDHIEQYRELTNN